MTARAARAPSSLVKKPSMRALSPAGPAVREDQQTAAAPEPHGIVARIDREIFRMSPLTPFASLFLAPLDPATGRLDYCSAGHPPALLLHADGRIESLSEGGTLLGVLPDASFDEARVELGAGDTLLVYSDGILEARDPSDQEFGRERRRLA